MKSALDDLALQPTAIYRGTPQYPGRLSAFLGDRAPATLRAAGNLDVLAKLDSGQSSSLAIAASVASPSSITQPALDLLRSAFRADVVFIGGFHSPLERACLELLVKERERTIICPARTLIGSKIPSTWRRAMHDGRLLLFSAAHHNSKRPTRESVQIRNECVAGLASNFLVLHAVPESKTEALCRRLISTGKPVWALSHPVNRHLADLGIPSASAATISAILRVPCSPIE
jgi:predicted Rossmann fold nucleotide-binding protein DprA/Smf involved in DNA uptake